MAEIPIKPIGREQIHKLESALFLGTIFSEEVLDILKNPEERLTWVDSIAVAAAAIARESAGMTTSQIAEDIGRSEASVKNHLKGKTKAGALVLKTYERFKRGEVSINFENVFKYKEKLDKIKEELKKIVEELENL
ncbi:MAG: regulator [Candidatus Asgardarchaeia archaeon]